MKQSEARRGPGPSFPSSRCLQWQRPSHRPHILKGLPPPNRVGDYAFSTDPRLQQVLSGKARHERQRWQKHWVGPGLAQADDFRQAPCSQVQHLYSASRGETRQSQKNLSFKETYQREAADAMLHKGTWCLETTTDNTQCGFEIDSCSLIGGKAKFPVTKALTPSWSWPQSQTALAKFTLRQGYQANIPIVHLSGPLGKSEVGLGLCTVLRPLRDIKDPNYHKIYAHHIR